MADEIYDVNIPLAETPGGDFDVVTGDALITQRIHLGYITEPGQFHDLPDWGAGLEYELSRTQSPTRLLSTRRRIERFLQDTPEVEDFEVSVERTGASETTITTRVKYDGREVLLPEVSFA